MKSPLFPIILFLLSSPAFSSPFWITQLRTGTSQMKVQVGNEYYFRNNYKNNNLSETLLCEEAVRQNQGFIKQSYPFAERIPMTVQIVYYDSEYKDCSTTISVQKSILDEIEQLNRYAKENLALKSENARMRQEIASNLVLKREKTRLGAIVASFLDEKLVIKNALKTSIYVGMSLKEVGLVLKREFNKDMVKAAKVCYTEYGSPFSLSVDDTVVCLKDEDNFRVTGICKDKCWRNE